MRSLFGSLVFQASCSALAIVGVVAGGADAADVSPRYALNGSSVVGEFAVMTDLEPLSQIAAMRHDDVLASPSLSKEPAAADTELRASVPAANRSRSLFGGGEVFANSAAVLPLLVGDFEPAISPVSRPLSGRLVGARPSLPINRTPLTSPLAQRSAR